MDGNNGDNRLKDELIEDVLSFLDTFCHHALYCFKVYPHGVFQKRLKFGAVAFKTTHRELHNYLQSCSSSLKPLLLRDLLASLEIVFIGKMAEVLYKVTLDIKLGDHQNIFDVNSRLQLHKMFQSILLKLSQFSDQSKLKEIFESFRIQVVPSIYITNSQLLEFQNQSFRFLDITGREENSNANCIGFESSAIMRSNCDLLSLSLVVSDAKNST